MHHPSSRWPHPLACVAAALALFLAGCGSKPPVRASKGAPAPSTAKGGGYYQDDGPGDDVPPDLASIPDAQPRVEPLRAGGPNKPYTVLGRSYQPVAADVPMKQRGVASWYGRKFHGKPTANGERYDMYAMTAAHPTMPLPSYARVRHLASGREVIVRVNDRGPFHGNRIIDLSYAAALKLGIVGRGSALVEVERLTHDAIRAGTWRRDGDEGTALAAAPAPAVAPPAPLPAPPPPDPVASFAAAGAEPLEPPAGRAGTTMVVARAEPATGEPAAAAQGFWIQLGAFRQREGAETFRRRVSDEAGWLAPLLAIFSDSLLFRLQAGPYASRDEASAVAQRVREALQLVPSIVERR